MTDRPMTEKLTDIELTILRLAAEGCQDKEIGVWMDRSCQTIRHDMTRIRSKLQSRNRTQAVVIAMRAGVIGATL